MSVEAVILGFGVGIAVAMSGAGGGSLLTPLLMVVFKEPATQAVGTALAAIAPTKVVGAIGYARRGSIDVGVVLTLLLGGLPGEVLGIGLFARLERMIGYTALLRTLSHLVGAAILISALAVLLTLLLPARSSAKSASRRFGWRNVALVTLGFIVGAAVGVTSVGSGSLTLPLLVILLPWMNVASLLGSDIAFAAILTPVAAVAHARLGAIDYGLALSLLTGAIPGILLGVRAASAISPRMLRPLVAGAMIVLATHFL